MTAYANQKSLLLNRLLRTSWSETVSVPGDYALPSQALAAILAAADASISKRYRINVAAGTYDETIATPDAWVADTHYSVGDKVVQANYTYICITENTDHTFTAAKWRVWCPLDFTLTGGPYIDLCGPGQAAAAITLDNTGSDVVKMGGCESMIRGLTIQQNTTGSGAAYALHLDSDAAEVNPELQIVYDCSFRANKKAAIGIGIRAYQRIFILDCALQSLMDSSNGIGLYAHDMTPSTDAGASKLAVIGCTMNGKYGATLTSSGQPGHPRFLFSGCTFTGGVASPAITGITDFLVTSHHHLIGTAGIPDGSAVETSRTWTASGGSMSAIQGVLNGKPWYYATFATAGNGNAEGHWTLYWSTALSAWVLYRSDYGNYTGAAPAAQRPDEFETARAAGTLTDYFKLANTLYTSNYDFPFVGVGAYAAIGIPYMRPSKLDTVYYGVADEILVLLDSGDGANTFAHSGATQSDRTAVKDYGYDNPIQVETIQNGVLRALSWLDEIDPDYPAAADVVFGVDRGDGTTGTLGVPMLNIE